MTSTRACARSCPELPPSAIVFAGLLALFGVTAAAEAVTENQNLLPGLIALGAFAVPVSFVVLVRELLPSAQVPVRTVAICFVAGGVLGTALAGPSGSVDAATQVLLLRGALAPFGHPAWTGLICAVLWWARTRWDRTRAASLLVPAALLAAVTLHGGWNGFDGPLIGVAVMAASLLLLGIWLLLARRELRPAPAAPLPA